MADREDACLIAASRVSSCSLTRAMNDRIVRCGIISSCQLAATSEMVKHFCPAHESDLCKMRYSKCRTLTFFLPFPIYFFLSLSCHNTFDALSLYIAVIVMVQFRSAERDGHVQKRSSVLLHVQLSLETDLSRWPETHHLSALPHAR